MNINLPTTANHTIAKSKQAHKPEPTSPQEGNNFSAHIAAGLTSPFSLALFQEFPILADLLQAIEQFTPTERKDTLDLLNNLPKYHFSSMLSLLTEYKKLCTAKANSNMKFIVTPQIIQDLLGNIEDGVFKLTECLFNSPSKALASITLRNEGKLTAYRVYKFLGYPFKRCISCHPKDQSALVALKKRIYSYPEAAQQIAFSWIKAMEDDQILALAKALFRPATRSSTGRVPSPNTCKPCKLSLNQLAELLLKKLEFTTNHDLREAIVACCEYTPPTTPSQKTNQKKPAIDKKPPVTDNNSKEKVDKISPLTPAGANTISFKIGYPLNGVVRFRKLETKEANSTTMSNFFSLIEKFSDNQRQQIYQVFDQLSDEQLYQLYQEIAPLKWLTPITPTDQRSASRKSMTDPKKSIVKLSFNKFWQYLVNSAAYQQLSTANRDYEILTLSYTLDQKLHERKLKINPNESKWIKQLLQAIASFENSQQLPIYRWMDTVYADKLYEFFKFVRDQEQLKANDLSLNTQQANQNLPQLSYADFTLYLQRFFNQQIVQNLYLFQDALQTRTSQAALPKKLHPRNESESSGTSWLREPQDSPELADFFGATPSKKTQRTKATPVNLQHKVLTNNFPPTTTVEDVIEEIIAEEETADLPNSSNTANQQFANYLKTNVASVKFSISTLANLPPTIKYYRQMDKLCQALNANEYHPSKSSFVPFLNPYEVVVNCDNQPTFALTQEVGFTNFGMKNLIMAMAKAESISSTMAQRLELCYFAPGQTDWQQLTLRISLRLWLTNISQSNSNKIFIFILCDNSQGYSLTSTTVFAAKVVDNNISLHIVTLDPEPKFNLKTDQLAQEINKTITIIPPAYVPLPLEIPRSCKEYLSILLGLQMLKAERFLTIEELLLQLHVELQPASAMDIIDEGAISLALAIPPAIAKLYKKNETQAYQTAIEEHIMALINQDQSLMTPMKSKLVSDIFLKLQLAKLQLLESSISDK
jgi:hypothetical protein